MGPIIFVNHTSLVIFNQMLAVLYSNAAWKCWSCGHTREEDKNTNNIRRKHNKYFDFLLFVQTTFIPNIMTTNQPLFWP